MHYKKLGNTKIRVSAIGQGTMGVGGFFTRDATNDASQVELLKKGIELGLNLIDTAEAYGGGHTEELVGQAIKGKRKKVFISTKVSPEHLSYEEVIRAAEGSLQRLGTDYLDLYQIHWPNPVIPLKETLKAMEKLLFDGKVRYVGVSNFTLPELKKAQMIFRGKIVSNQVEYNLFDRTVEEDLLPYCEKEKISLIAYSPLDKGKFANGRERVEVLKQIAQKYGKTVAQIVLRWLISHPAVIPIPKPSSIANLEENASAADFTLEKDDIELINKTCWQPVISIPVETIKTDKEGLDKFVPRPEDLAKSIKEGIPLKPVRVKRLAKKIGQYHYELVEGKVRYWSWFFAYDGKVPIRALVRED